MKELNIEALGVKYMAVLDELNLTYLTPNDRRTAAGRKAHNRKNYLYAKRKRYERIIDKWVDMLIERENAYEI